jgi:hypothetical protein
MPISVGVNLLGDFKNSDELKNNKGIIEDILNVITNAMCENDKNDKMNLIHTIRETIRSRYPDYYKICTKTPIAGIGQPCDNGTILFTDERIGKIIEQINNDNLYRRMCKFKYSVLNDKVNANILRKVLYATRYVPFQNFMFPSTYPIVNYGFFGGNSNNINPKGLYGLGCRIVNGEYQSNKFVDFDEFVKQYENYHTPHNNYSDNSTYSEDANIENSGKNIDIDIAYKMIKRLDKIKKIEDALDDLEILLNYIKYFVLPLKTLEKSELIHKQIN